ncbi:hypothetical protein K1719_042534 [Acacia pycnantha]|nr:hypothetical protein K1719_042534 [Acacia pycnantha]
MDQPREGIVYNFQNFRVLENDDKYRITTTPWKFNFHNHTYIEEADVVISNEAYNLKTIPKLNKAILSQESVGSQLFSQISNVDYPTYSSKSLLTFRTRIPLCDISKLDQECDIVTKVTIPKCETLYGWMYDACPCDKKPEYQSNGSLRCTKCDKDVLMTVPKYKVHYKVYDDTGKCSVIFFDRHATELLGQSASKIKEAMQQEGRNTTIPKELDEIAGKVVIVKLRIKSHNIKHRTSSIGVTQFCGDNHLVAKFLYSDQEEETTEMVEESAASRQTVCTKSQDNVIEDDDNTLSQLITPPEANTKRKTLGNGIPVLTLSPSVQPTSQSVNQKKSVKRSASQIRQVATDLCSRVNTPVYENSRVINNQHEQATHHTEAENNHGCMFRSTYLDDGDACHECQVCGAEMWFAKRLKGVKKNEMPQFGICCCNGKIIVPLLRRPPKELEELFFNKHSMQSKFVLKNIRTYNNIICFTSMGGRIDHSINSRGGDPYSFVLSGQNHHFIGSLLPPQGNPPVYAQLYIYDTENEISNRMSAASRYVGVANLDHNIFEILKLAALIVGDFDNSYTKRDIIVKRQCGKLRRIDELHMAYLPPQYPLLFPYGDNGYDSSNQHALESLSATKKKKKLTPREYPAFR